MNKTFLGILIAVVVIGGGAFYYVNYAEQGNNPFTNNENSKYFMDQMVAKGVEDVGQPIEGFDNNLLVMAFPGLVNTDFQGVETFEGHYELKNGIVEMIRDKSSPISSAERTVSEDGYKTLLENLVRRLNMKADSRAAIDTIIAKIDTDIKSEEEVVVSINQSRSALGITIMPIKVLEESRCASDVQCIQAGTVRLQAKLTSGTGTANQEFKLNETITTEAEEITLVKVEPYPISTKKIQPSEYKFYFKIKKR